MKLKRCFAALIALLMLITVSSAFPAGAADAASDLTSPYYYVDADGGFIYDVQAETSVSVLLSRLKNASGAVVYDGDGAKQDGTAQAATGFSVVCGGKPYSVIVKGDVNGDGVLSTADYAACRALFANGYDYKTASARAADIDYNGGVYTSDYLKLKAHFKGVLDIYASKHPLTKPAVTYEISFVPGENGTLDGQTSFVVEEGTSFADVAVPTPVPNTGYRFKGWSPSLPDTVVSDGEYKAEFERDPSQYATVTFVPGAHGSLTGEASFTVLKGTAWSAITVPTPKADAGYKFGSWSPSFPQTVTADAIYTASFVYDSAQYATVTFAPGAHGSLTGETSFTVLKGTLWSKITVPSPVAESGYVFKEWSPSLPSADTAINGSASYTAAFEKEAELQLKGVININGVNGSQNVAGGSYVYTSAYGGTFTAKYWQVFAAEYSAEKGGYIVTAIYGNGDSKSLTVPANGILVAVHDGEGNQPACADVAIGDVLVPNTDINLNSGEAIEISSFVSIYAGDGTTPDPEPTYQPQNFDNFKAMWLSQFDLYSVYTSGSSQRAESSFRTYMERVLDNCVKVGVNTVIVQVRPNGDSMYPSDYYPMSRYVVGNYGKDATYDPFKIVIDLAHARGLSVQAWINPMRLMTASEITRIRTKYKIGEWYASSEYNGKYIVQFGNNYYLNPAYEEVRNLIINGAREICEKYDVDGLHMDDYFYPTTDPSFDSAAYKEYGSFMSLANWRRDNLNKLVKGIYNAVKAVDGDIIFGISPAGTMSTVINEQYADVRKWCSSEGYIDYICPQVYFGMKHAYQAFDSCSSGWAAIITNPNIKLFVGMTLGKAVSGYSGGQDPYAGTEEGKNEWINNRDVLKTCLIYLRDELKQCTGVAFFCCQYFYNPTSGAENPATAEERANFLPVLQSMWN